MINYKDILEILKKHDPMSIDYGDNIDEYKPEAIAIAMKIKRDYNENEILSIVYEEFSRLFDNKNAGSKEKYIGISKDIYSSLKNN